ncbi:MAG: response regulator [Bacteroidetes bacterium]|jgi:PAS domain S-box-containing protein|nr:response regulator [Deltaproteobacteria bacterium]MBT4268492.1 response regulator [Deltaproteobacteria bacterium]MBT4644423.1 response regulator [Deltaproteobacteria bacterium]MBT7466162.1 response regulator [Bacteroidota bacterium]
MKKYKILLVDDDPFILQTIGPALEDKGYEITTIGNGADAISLINKSPYDLVLTDLMMENIDGFQVLKAVKKLETETMVIVLTGYGDVNLAIDCLRLGADDFVLKPCKLEELLFRLKNCFGNLETKEKIKRTEEKLVEKTLYLDSILRSASESAITTTDLDLCITYCNPLAETFFGRTADEVIGKTVQEIHIMEGVSQERLYKAIEQVHNKGEYLYEVTQELDSGVRHLKSRISGITNTKEELVGFALFSHDITKSKRAEEIIKANLKEKETLLHEIHHRVKNNMTVISSLLGLQIINVSDEKAKEALQDSQNRVQTMSRIHETLYRSDNLSAIDMKTYLSELGATILQGYTNSGNVNLKVKAENIMIEVRQASSLGLIANELITNSIKYAFPDDRKGEIVLDLKSNEENEVELIVSDNGIGIPEGLDLEKTDSLGLKLVKNITENQLNGSIEMESKNGTKFTIKFNIET